MTRGPSRSGPPRAGPRSSGPESQPLLVGVGASAGGVDALTSLFAGLTDARQATFLVVLHTSPDHESRLPAILGSVAPVPVEEARDGQRLEPGKIFTVPPGTLLEVEGSEVRFRECAAGESPLFPIDHLFTSLARAAGARCAGIVLTGTGDDGAGGVEAIAGGGGLVIVQRGARHEGMPRNAKRAEDGALELELEEIPAALGRWARELGAEERDGRAPGAGGGSRAPNGTARSAPSPPDELVVRILSLLEGAGHDYRAYKRSTVRRRLQRRMGVRRIEDPEEYLELLRSDAQEVDALASSMLIGVTRFFRDPPAWEHLREDVIPRLLADLDDGETLRAWVPGCSTGEEAFTLAITLRRAIEDGGRDVRVKVFATDVDPRALARARAAVYRPKDLSDLEPEVRDRFFRRDGGKFRVVDEIRERVVFAPQNLLEDPPYSNLDLVSCRDVLIYFEQRHQARVFSLFHFGLRSGGVLMLGTSETVGSPSDLFAPISARWSTFVALGEGRPRSGIGPPLALTARTEEVKSGPRRPTPPPGGSDPAALTRDLLLRERAPAAALVDARRNVLYLHGDVDRFLRLPAGRRTDDLLDLAPQELRLELLTVLRQARDRGETVRGGRGPFVDRGAATGRISATPVSTDDGEQRFLVCFDVLEEGETEPRPRSESELVRDLEEELATTRADLMATIEQLESSNQELETANQEVQSVNEEYQTSQEELQSLNEELTTLNQQLEGNVRELEATRDDLENLLVGTQIPTLLLDRDLRIRRFTAPATRLFTLREGDEGRPLADFATLVEDPGLVEDAEAVLREKKSVDREVRDRDDSWYARRIQPYATSDQRIDGVVITYSDVTRLKRAEQSLAERERMLRLVTDNLPVLIAYVDRELRYEFVNAEYHEWFGISPPEAAGRPVREIVGDEAFERMRESIEEALSGRRSSRESSVPFRTAGDRYVRIDRIPHRTGDGEVVGYFELVSDLGERRELELQQARLAAIVESTQEAILSKTLDGTILSWNRAAERLYGYTAEEAVGSPVFLIAPDGEGEQRGLLERLARGEHIAPYETVRVTKDGRRLDILLTISPVRDRDGEVVAASAIAQDITDRKAAERQLREQAARLEVADRRKDQFLAMLAHELRNPMSPMVSALELLRRVRERQDPDLQERALQILDRQVAHLGRLVDDLLDVARISRDRIELRRELVTLREVVEAGISTALPEIEGRGHRLERSLPEEPRWVFGDRVRLTQVVSNLLQNAAKFTPEGGRIAVSVEREREDLVLAVQDDGRGIEPEALADIFDLFSQEPRPLDRKEGGLGLGLSLVRRLVEMHGGSVRAFSEGAGRGSRFEVRLPEVEARQLQEEPTADPPEPPAGSRRILVVDDRPDSADSLSQLLELDGHRVWVAYDGLRALELAREATPDLVLLDIGLPELDGYEVARRLRSEELDPRPVLVAVTGYGREEDRRLAREAGFDHHLSKPVALDRLARIIAEIDGRAE